MRRRVLSFALVVGMAAALSSILQGPAGASPVLGSQAAAVSNATSASCNGTLPAGTVVGIAATKDDGGYWIANSQGLVVACGDAQPSGELAGAPNEPIVGIAAAAGGGYYLVAADGGIFTFGSAPYYGSMGGHPLNQPIVGMAAAPTGKGYWEVARDGGIFTFGSAVFHGSTGAMALNKPIVGMATDAGTGGYWLVASDGGIFTFDAPFLGSMGGTALSRPIVAMESNSTGSGYRLVASDGGIFDFGTSSFFGSAVAPSTAPTPPPPSGSSASCSVVLSNDSPADGTEETATIRSNVPNSAVTLKKAYRTVTSYDHGYTDATGDATIEFNITDATAGYRVVVTVTVGSASCTTSFTPQ